MVELPLAAATPSRSSLDALVPPARRVAAFVRWLRSHRGAVSMAGLLSFAAPLTFFTGALSVMREPTTANWTVLALWWVLHGLELWVLLLVFGYACLHLMPASAMALTRSACWIGGAFVSAACVSITTAGRAGILVDQGVVQSVQTLRLYSFTLSLTMALFYFGHLRRSRSHEAAVMRLAAAQAAQHDVRRRIVQAHLAGLQARIDPQLLFGMLEAVKRSYLQEPQQAERLLDELITFLRASLPRLAATSSSVPREAELAQAYGRLQALAGQPGCSVALDLSAEVIHAGFPPGVLLPLLDDVWRSCAGPCTLSAERHEVDCRVTLSLPARPSEPALVRVRSLLAEVCGPTAWLAIEDNTSAIRATVQIPHELA